MEENFSMKSDTTVPFLLEAISVKRSFGSGDSTAHVLKGADLTVPPGRLVALKGRSGSGKTTLLNILATLDQPSEGRVLFKGDAIHDWPESGKDRWRRTRLGLVFQSFALIPYMSAVENVEFGLRIAGVNPDRRRVAAEEALTFVGLKTRMNHRPQELSGGEQQRTAIARAIAHEPEIVLADEPTAELDSRMGLQVMKVFRELVESKGISIIMTTHDPAIMEIVDTVYVLEDGQIVERNEKE
jgi:putative ABC transport system ATP-binding protein